MFVKICGLRRAAEVEAAVDAGADAVGLMFTTSPRQVTIAEARELAAVAKGQLLTVGVFTTERTSQVREVATQSGVVGIQLHGPHPVDDFTALRDLPVTLIRAQAAHTEFAGGEDLVIVDAPRPGSGETWHYGAARGQQQGKWLLAGGLRPDNVADAIEAAQPWGVDVSSGVESSRGIKDIRLIHDFVAAAKAAG